MEDRDPAPTQPTMPDLYNSNPQQLASLLDVEEAAADVSKAWRPEELASVLRHQLAVPLAEDLGEPVLALGRELESSGGYQGLASQTFGDLLRAPAPPVEALQLVKRFAKAGRAQHGALLPPEVATALYYAAILVARHRCDARITGLEDGTIAEGRGWILAQPWIDPDVKSLVAEPQAMATAPPIPGAR